MGRVYVDLEGEGIDRPLRLALPTVPEKVTNFGTLSPKVIIHPTIWSFTCVVIIVALYVVL